MLGRSADEVEADLQAKGLGPLPMGCCASLLASKATSPRKPARQSVHAKHLLDQALVGSSTCWIKHLLDQNCVRIQLANQRVFSRLIRNSLVCSVNAVFVP